MVLNGRTYFRLRRFASGFCPGACGSPFLGEFSLASRTSSSRRVFGAVRTCRMTSLKCLNSGVESNGLAFILSSLGCGVSFRVPAVCEEEVVSSILQIVAGKFLVGYPESDNPFHDSGEPLCVLRLPVIVAERLLIEVSRRLRLEAGTPRAAIPPSAGIAATGIHASQSAVRGRSSCGAHSSGSI